MVDDEIGYIKVSRFAETTHMMNFKETKLKYLVDQGMKKLIIDLQSNPGGYMPDSAVNISDELLSDNHSMIVSQEGKECYEQTLKYKA